MDAHNHDNIHETFPDFWPNIPIISKIEKLLLFNDQLHYNKADISEMEKYKNISNNEREKLIDEMTSTYKLCAGKLANIPGILIESVVVENELIIGALLDAGADINATDESGRSALDWAQRIRRNDITKLFQSWIDIHGSSKNNQRNTGFRGMK